MKKRIAILFVLLANIILLAHAVLPHHYHEKLFCIESTHCTEDATIHTQNSTEHNHQHDGTDNTTCVLNQVVIILPNQGRILNEFENCTDTCNHNFYITAPFEYPHLQSLPAIVSTVPKLNLFFTTFVSPTLGLRAPPVV
jgi:hypothetical protein